MHVCKIDRFQQLVCGNESMQVSDNNGFCGAVLG